MATALRAPPTVSCSDRMSARGAAAAVACLKSLLDHSLMDELAITCHYQLMVQCWVCMWHQLLNSGFITAYKAVKIRLM
ncbi:hypothetical protein JOB18_041918 [Solea senegalensis]|uniref:Uncharacterized protein n=1 Tax=Solea senegalensis TaxID=28829 RepID=A0AAV6RH50_SOLSE|nr:hypothetical protein JOB18_041918 [Solea senegalensis]